MSKIKTAVIGAGYLGQYHVEKFAAASDLVAVCDVDAKRCQAVASQHGAAAVTQYRELVGQVDAVSVVTPTPLHHDVSLFFLQNDIHVLVEKPIATTLKEADNLIRCAQERQLILQVGHLERFNNAIRAVEPLLDQPRFIESTRLAPFKLRGTEVNVILDLMIHDIDIIQSIVKAEIERISASGAPILSSSIDIANVRIEFTNGCVASVTASRVSDKQKRRLRIFQHDGLISLDLDRKNIIFHRKGDGEMFPGIPNIMREVQRYDKGDALNDEIHAFLDSVRTGRPPAVTGEDGKRALATAMEITNIVREANEKFPLVAAE